MVRSARFDAVIFDIDDVLVDVSRSYLECIAKTVQLYLEQILGVASSRSPQLLNRQDVLLLKLLGGFNNDWDSVYGFLLYFQFLKEKTGREWQNLSIPKLRKLKNLRALAGRLRTPGPSGMKALVKEKDLISYDLARDMFQEIYLGPRLFKQLYRRTPFFYRQNGLNRKERLLFPKGLLQRLRKRGVLLGIVTGRIRFEADYVLQRFGIKNLFRAIVTHDDIGAQERKRSGNLGKPVTLRKPHPYGLLLAAKKLGFKKRFLYIGDLPDDIEAARRAKKEIRIASCGFLSSKGSRGKVTPPLGMQLKRAGADFLIKSPKELLKIIGKIW